MTMQVGEVYARDGSTWRIRAVDETHVSVVHTGGSLTTFRLLPRDSFEQIIKGATRLPVETR
jgi:hypothetical protein